MRRTFLLLCVAAFLVSCDSGNPVGKYGDTVVRGYKNAERAGSKASVDNLQESVRAFRAAHDRYPADLKELGAFAGTALDDSTYQYDPANGVITLTGN